MLNQYGLFSEWRSRTLYGETLSDALTRAKKLQRPDEYGGGQKIANGEWVEVARIVQSRDTSKSTRGGKSYESVIIETADGRYLDVDAIAGSVELAIGDRINDRGVVV